MSGALVTAALADVADLNPSLRQVPAADEPVSFLPMSAVDAERTEAVDSETRPFAEVSKGYTPFLPNDVLVAKITPCFENGKIALAKPTRRFGFGSTEFHVVRAHARRLDPRYLVHFMRQERIRFDGQRRMTGSAGQRRVPEHFLAGLQIPVPPLPEQRRIAEILDKAEALRVKRRAAIAELGALTQSIFLDMFGRPKDNPKGWPLVSLMDICSPKQWPTISTAELTETGFPVFGANGLIGYFTEYNHEVPTVLITCRGATCGTINVSPPKCYVTGNAMALDDPDPRLITIDYLAAVLRMRSMADTISGTAQPQITRQNLEHVKVPLPPPALQSEFARRGTAIAQTKARQNESLSALDAIFASLQHRAFEGEL